MPSGPNFAVYMQSQSSETVDSSQNLASLRRVYLGNHNQTHLTGSIINHSVAQPHSSSNMWESAGQGLFFTDVCEAQDHLPNELVKLIIFRDFWVPPVILIMTLRSSTLIVLDSSAPFNHGTTVDSSLYSKIHLTSRKLINLIVFMRIFRREVRKPLLSAQRIIFGNRSIMPCRRGHFL